MVDPEQREEKTVRCRATCRVAGYRSRSFPLSRSLSISRSLALSLSFLDSSSSSGGGGGDGGGGEGGEVQPRERAPRQIAVPSYRIVPSTVPCRAVPGAVIGGLGGAERNAAQR